MSARKRLIYVKKGPLSNCKGLISCNPQGLHFQTRKSCIETANNITGTGATGADKSYFVFICFQSKQPITVYLASCAVVRTENTTLDYALMASWAIVQIDIICIYN